MLGTTPLREVVVGRVGSLVRPFAAEPRVRDARAFKEYAEPGHVKILLAFQLAAEERGERKGTRVTAALRVWSASDVGARALRALWPVVSTGGGVVSRAFVAALEGRAVG